ncbi:hypothetical protein KIN20_035953 [Parelaphostrongylus tenuis]|uniref:Uncharacterized protein n=1 Tax=Parelaphostrongylus tenuis TaxID=148309 RepID=A0AAD5WKV8_PARTN|nr:hypothetical protein KIN20_035953 [Parelaphostrongylus tenuis]
MALSGLKKALLKNQPLDTEKCRIGETVASAFEDVNSLTYGLCEKEYFCDKRIIIYTTKDVPADKSI